MFWYIISINDLIIFVLVAITVTYMTFFAVASLFYQKFRAPHSNRKGRFLVIIPAYHCDDIYHQTFEALEQQDYDHRNFDILVVSSGNKPITNMRLAQYNVTLQIMPEDSYTDVKAWQYGIQHAPALRIYDMAVIVEAGETIEPSYLSEINNAYQLGSRAIQTHRLNKNRTTPSAIMASTFEDINSTVFRMGHVAVGLSSGLLGSGMAFDYKWFRKNVVTLPEDSDLKAFEVLVLENQIYIDFLDETFFYSKPSGHLDGIHTSQRTGWMYAQWHAFRSNVKKLPLAIIHHNYDLVDKIIQWAIMPRVVMMSIITLMCLITPLFWWSMTIKWIITGLWFMFVCAIATPDYLVDRAFEKAFIHAPIMMAKSLFYALPSGWLVVFARNHHEEWKEEVLEQTERLKEQTSETLKKGIELTRQYRNNKDAGNA